MPGSNRYTFILLILFAFGIGPARGEDAVCDDPTLLCKVDPSCTERLGAGSVGIDGQADAEGGLSEAACDQQWAVYRSCLELVVRQCGEDSASGADAPPAPASPQETASDSAPSTPPGVSQTDLTVAQRELARLGKYQSSIDGLWGPGSIAALASFQRDLGVSPADGVLSPTLLQALLAAPTPSAAPAPVPAPSPAPETAGGCTADDARTEWETLKRSNEITTLQVFARFCGEHLQGQLAAARVRELGQASTGSGGTADDTASRPEGLTINPSGIWFYTLNGQTKRFSLRMDAKYRLTSSERIIFDHRSKNRWYNRDKRMLLDFSSETAGVWHLGDAAKTQVRLSKSR
ncbi:MAG: peptidoglycan-binding protein [Rhodobacteraceae bacterium]|nr:peptidoglycan-binding protein [Paracoccaceae bacterium]